MILDGTPPTIAYGGISFVTKAPAPIIAPSPILTPARMLTPRPIQTSLPIITLHLSASETYLYLSKQFCSV